MNTWLKGFGGVLLLALTAYHANADELSDLKATIQMRAPAIEELKANGILQEGSDGLLVGGDAIDSAQRNLLDLENADRVRVFQVLSGRTDKTADEIAKTFARMAIAARRSATQRSRSAEKAASPDPGASTAGSHHPVPLPDNSALPSKVVTRPFASIYKEPKDGAKVRENVPPFSAFYVSEQTPGWFRISADGQKSSLGWIREEDVVEWKQNLVVEFTHPEGRQPVLMFNDKSPLKTLLAAPRPDRVAQANAWYSVINGGDIPAEFPVRTMEPRRAVKSHDQFYVLPIVDFEEIKIDGREGRILRLAAATRQRGVIELTNPQDRAQLNRPTDLRSAVAKGVKVDLVFVMDLTRSMGPFANRTLEMVRRISSQLGSDDQVMEAVRFGFWGFRDFPELCKGIEYNTKNYTPELQRLPAFAETLKAVQETKIDSIDFEEDVLAGVVDAVQRTRWRPNALRLMVLVGDAPGRGPKEKDFNCDRADCPSGTKSGMNAESVRALMDEGRIFATALYLKAPKWLQYAERGERQFRAISRNTNAQPGNENFRAIDAADTNDYGQIADSLAAGIIDEILKSQGRGGDGPASSSEKAASSEANSAEVARAAGRELARNMFRGAMVEWLGKAEAATVPRDVTVWAVDKDLVETTVQSLEVQVFLTKNELNSLKLVMDEVLNAGILGKISGKDFFQALQAVTAAAARDASQIRNAATLAQTSLIPKFLNGLPYRSTLMDMSNETWARMSPDRQDQFLHAAESKLHFYQAVHDNAENWQALNEGDDRDNWVAAIPLEQLP